MPAPRTALVVGAGRMGALHERVAREAGLAVHTVDPHRPADFADLETAPRAEVVVVATPIALLAETACAAMRRGCERLLVEKPMAATLAEGRAVLECARTTATRLSVGFTERYDPAVATIRGSLLAQAGPVRALEFERLSAASAPAGASAQLDLAVHDLDLLRHLGFAATRIEDAAVTPDGVRARLGCDGVPARLHAGYDAPRAQRRFVVEGERARVECDLLRGTVAITRDSHREECRPRGPEPLAAEWHAVLNGGGPSGACGLAALELALALTP